MVFGRLDEGGHRGKVTAVVGVTIGWAAAILAFAWPVRRRTRG